jgi:uncharacterized protein YndB with AHSA1/START domain
MSVNTNPIASMPMKTVITPVVKSITVECTPEEAFRYFTAEINKWWPLERHSCIAHGSGFKEKPASCLFEQHRGGRIIERGHSGEEHVWGTVLVWNPPSRVAFSWHPMRDEKTAQTVDVRFSLVPKGTQVVLTHSDWEHLGANAQKESDIYNEGWEDVFVKTYGEYVRSRK